MKSELRPTTTFTTQFKNTNKIFGDYKISKALKVQFQHNNYEKIIINIFIVKKAFLRYLLILLLLVTSEIIMLEQIQSWTILKNTKEDLIFSAKSLI